MSDPGLIEILSALMTMLIDQLWTMVAGAFDATRNISAFGAGMAILGMCAMAFGVAKTMQARLVTKLDDDPESTVSLLRQEAAFSLPGLAMFLLALPFLIIQWVISTLGSAIGSLFSSDDEDEDEDEDEEEEEPVPLLVASIGPSFMWAGLIVAGIFVLSLLAEPLLRYQFDLSEGYPAWQYLLLGGRAELEWYVPLGRFPYLGALASLFVWGTLWWWAGRAVRIFLGSDIGSNLADQSHNSGVLPSWRTWFGARFLAETDATYRRWAWVMVIAAVPFLFWAWSTFAAEPYRINGSLFAVSLLLWLSWLLHLTLSGTWREIEEAPAEEPEPEPEQGAGWAEVLADLEGRLGVREPSIEAPPRLVEPPKPAARASKSGLLSPLLDEVLPEGEKPTHMQQAVLETLSHQAYVHVDPPQKAGELALGRTSSAGMDDESGLRHRNQVVLAPDASGKTTLAMLAACNHALVHTRATLIVTRDEEAAESFAEMLRSALEPSTLRWTVRVRNAGSTLVNDLSQGIIPDVIVTSLHALVGSILDKPRTYAPFLKNLGLIIVDDVNRFAARSRSTCNWRFAGSRCACASFWTSASSARRARR
ncbi:MAG: DEAD/DEAH box helicase [Persicimonas sp.]